MSRRIDYGTLAGLAVAVGGILGGLVFEHGQAQDLMQGTAALIVFGGTAGAILVSTPWPALARALRRSRVVFFEESGDKPLLVEQISAFATQARHRGIASLEADALKAKDPFVAKALTLISDGIDTMEIRRQLELEMRIEEDRADADARVFEAAAGYAPTIGIVGAVLGLIQVMKRLDNFGEVGRGIAVAFVATIYGVGIANLVLFPAGAKMRARAARETERREMILEGMAAIAEGLHPYLVRSRLQTYLDGRPSRAGERTPATRPVTARSGA